MTNKLIIKHRAYAGDLKKMEFEFSPENFYKYYNAFNKFYVSYLIVVFSKTLKSQIGLKHEIWKRIKLLDADLQRYITWPEIVTFEEMNIKRPSDLFSIFNMSLKRITGS